MVKYRLSAKTLVLEVIVTSVQAESIQKHRKLRSVVLGFVKQFFGTLLGCCPARHT